VNETARTGLVGLLMGVALSRIGFTDWDEVHRMFTFADLRLLFAFAGSVAILAVGWKVITKMRGGDKPGWNPRLIHNGTLAGGALFGAGWALSGACPSIALVQLGEGQLGALATLAGIVGGNWLYGVIHQRYLGWSTGSCVDD
jgi:uncharacterized protein